jgi:hypothetical protein
MAASSRIAVAVTSGRADESGPYAVVRNCHHDFVDQ